MSGGRFEGGKSGNPGGRSRASAAVARMIREATADGQELVDFALKVWRGQVDEMNTEKSRQWAHDWLSDRGLGKPLQDLDVLFQVEEVSPEQRAMLEALRLSPHERRARIAQLRETKPPADDAG